MPEERCNELAESMDMLTEQERNFILWYTLQDLINDGNKIIEQEPKTAQEYKALRFTQKLVTAANDIRMVVGYNIWC